MTKNMTFTYEKPASLPEALALIYADSMRYPILAGGTDIIVNWRAGNIDLKGVIDISLIDELKFIRENNIAIEIGALMTHSDILASRFVNAGVPLLSLAASKIGAVQIQARGTIGGNIMNASPAADLPPVLLAYDASFNLQNMTGSRWVKASDFFTGYKNTLALPNELLTTISIPKRLPGEVARFYKIGTRRAQAISKVVMCIRGEFDHGGVKDIAIALGSVAPTAIRARGTEALLKSRALTPSLVELAMVSLADEISPIDDVRSNAEYRKHVCCSMLKRYLKDVSAPRPVPSGTGHRR